MPKGQDVASLLIVEDEPLIRMMIADMISELGYSVAGQAGDLSSGLALAAAPGVDAAILDVKLGNDSSEPIAKVLYERGIPFIFATGYRAEGVPEAFNEHPALEKPFPLEALQRCLDHLLARKEQSRAS